MEVGIINKALISIEYPGVVQNTERMLETMGGMTKINQIYNDASERLDLKFRPEDPFCKSIHADRFNTSNLLIKIIRRKNQQEKNDNSSSSIIRIEIVGKIQTTYKFRSMADFEYLPMRKKEENVYESFLDRMSPSGLVDSKWLQEECPMFILPPIFSRLDTPGSYHFRRDPVKRNSDLKTSKVTNIIGRGRAKRAGLGGIYVSFEEPMPTKPSNVNTPKALEFHKPTMERLEAAFSERPIWSRSALVGIKNIDYNLLKKFLPSLSYYFLNGPWRGLWVRFGYDPRKDPQSMKYQLLDLRLNS